MWETASATDAFRAAIAGAPQLPAAGSCACSGFPESEIAEHPARGGRRGARARRRSRSRPACGAARSRSRRSTSRRAEPAYDALVEFIAARHARHAVLARRLDGRRAGRARCSSGRTVAVAESCTGGLMAARLTDRPGSSAYFAGGVVAYSNEAKVELVGVDPALIERCGAVSTEVARGARRRGDRALRGRRRDRDHRDRRTGRRDRGEARRPRVLLGLHAGGGEQAAARITRSTRLPGNRADVRDRSTTVAMHLLRRVLLGETDESCRPAQVAQSARTECGQRDGRLERGARAGAAVRRARAAGARSRARCSTGARGSCATALGCGSWRPRRST